MALILARSIWFYGQDTVFTESKIEKVTVFLKGAQVKRTAECNLPEGISLVCFKNISGKADEKSIQVSAGKDIEIQSVFFGLNYLDTASMKSFIKKLTEKQDSLAFEKSKIENSLFVLNQEAELLSENQLLSGENKIIQSDELKKACDYYREKLTEIAVQKVNLAFGLKKLEAENLKITDQLQELNQGKSKPTAGINIIVKAVKAGNYAFNLGYFINDAGWTAKYDIRAESLNKPADLVYKADVYQNSDEDWKNVELTLSGANPMQSGIKPQLASWKLNVIERYSEDYSQENDNYYENLRNDFSSPIAVDNDMIISGRVVDGTDNSPLPGASILIKGTNIGVVTDLNGNYSVKVPKGTKNIVVTYIGYNSLELPITGQTVNCVMDAAELALDEVVVTGYGVQRKRDVTGAVSTMVNDGNGNLVSELQGYSPGIQIRGISSSRQRKERRKLAGKSLEGLNKLKEKQTSFEFVLDKPYSIPANNKNYTVDINKYEVPVDFQYSSIPKLEDAAFLMARITGWENLNLLSGQANIYFEGSFVGNSTINVEKTEDTLDISMGRDKGIIIERMLKEGQNEKKYIKDGKTEIYTCEINLKNTKDQKINLLVEDQIPVSISKNIEVELVNNQGATLDEKKGKLSWQLTLEPLEKKTLSFCYKIKFKNI